MDVAIIGAGPAGLFVGAALARRGHAVTAVDRDAGPPEGGAWHRRGVMQFHHAHAFRAQVVDALERELPSAYDHWIAAGAEPVRTAFPGADGEIVTGVRSQRETFERALRRAATEQPGLTIRIGHVEAVTSRRGRASGIVVDGAEFAADLVIDASGRSGRVSTRSVGERPEVGGSCGIAYVDRLYQLHPDASPGPLVNPIAFQADYAGYQVIVFPHERGIFSVLIVRPAADRELAGLRDEAAFTSATQAIPPLADWTDPGRAHPCSPVFPGGTLINAYRGQAGVNGRLLLPGLVFLGDSVCTTTPTFGRGLATTFLQCQEFLRLLDDDSTDLVALGEQLDDWDASEMRPWVEDHIRMDSAIQSRWEGHDIDLGAPLPSDLILAAGAVDPAIIAAAPPYLSMLAGPVCLRGVEPRARAVYETGWRPQPPPGPTAAELREVVAASRR